MKELPETFWAWLAGFFDGDGCIGIYTCWKAGYSYQVARAVIAQKERAILDYIVERTGSGSVTKRGKAPFGGQMHQLCWGSKQTRELCEKILPYLVVKREKAQIVLAWKKKKHALAVEEQKEFPVAVSLYKDGMNIREIAKRLGMKMATISYWIRTRGLSRTQPEAQRLRRKREKI